MSWLARSIANSLRIDDDDNDENHSRAPADHRRPENADVEGDRRGGMKDDLTEFRESLTRQIRGVASFLAPPPPSDHQLVSEWNRMDSPNPSVSGDDDNDSSVYGRISAARSDHSEIGGLFHGVNRMIFDNGTVSENYGLGLQNVDYVDDDGGGGGGGGGGDGYDEDWINEAAGLTDEVLTFAGNIAHHPETWLDFPIEDEEDLDGQAGQETTRDALKWQGTFSWEEEMPKP